eukprot:TRINITY_DN80352_c0_g1_i1.p1 TRINITY_DN80352_c0_g1~~TRINITY_DN80352_c0_g1_i1.p1  ORF type:complete len:802 (-),score=104.63 TRINITY_DN80352_c0_g1_i1:4-2382(-)
MQPHGTPGSHKGSARAGGLPPARAALFAAAAHINRGGAAVAVATAPLAAIFTFLNGPLWPVVSAVRNTCGAVRYVTSCIFSRTPSTARTDKNKEQVEMGRNQCTSIWTAVRQSDTKTVTSLVDEAPHLLELRGTLGETPLHWCFLYNYAKNRDLATKLLKKQPWASNHVYEGQEYLGENCLHFAIVHRDLEMVQFLVKRNPKLILGRAKGTSFQQGTPCYYGEYPLFFAACTNQPETVDFLLQHGANLNDVDSNGNTVFHLLVIHGLRDMYEYLEERWWALHGIAGATEEIPGLPRTNLREPWKRLNNEKLSAFTLAASIGHKEMFEYLLGKDEKVEWRYGPLSYHLHALEELDYVPDGGRPTALQLLVEKEHTELLVLPRVKALLQTKWQYYGERIFRRRLLVMFFYLMVFTGVVISRPHKGEALWPVPAWIALAQAFVVFGAVYKASIELRELRANGLQGYFCVRGSMFLENITSLVYSLCVCIATGLRLSEIYGFSHFDTSELLIALAAISGWLYFLFFFLGNRMTGPFVIMIFKMLAGDVLRFCMIYVVFLTGFSTAFYVVFQDRGISGFLNRVKCCFFTMLGEFDGYDTAEQPFPLASFIILVAYIVVVTILLLNLLVAMMGDTYANISHDAETQWHLERARIIFSLENEMSPETRSHPKNVYWTEMDGKRYMPVLENSNEPPEPALTRTKSKYVREGTIMVEPEERGSPTAPRFAEFPVEQQKPSRHAPTDFVRQVTIMEPPAVPRSVPQFLHPNEVVPASPVSPRRIREREDPFSGLPEAKRRSV